MSIIPIKKERPEAVMFDWAGVLAKDAFGDLEANDRCAGAFGRPTGTINAAKNLYWPQLCIGEITEEQFWERVAQRVIDSERVCETGEFTIEDDIDRLPKYLQELRTKMLESHRLYPFSFDLAEMYKSQGIPVGIATNSCKEWFAYWDEKFGLSESFNPIVASYRIGKRKPEPAFYLEMMRILREQYEIEYRNHVLFYDDQERNIEAAGRLGICAVEFKPWEWK